MNLFKTKQKYLLNFHWYPWHFLRSSTFFPLNFYVIELVPNVMEKKKQKQTQHTIQSTIFQ